MIIIVFPEPPELVELLPVSCDVGLDALPNAATFGTCSPAVV
jgi:hypothetical protein